MKGKRSYSHHRSGDNVLVEIRDCRYKVLYKKKFEISDVASWMEVISLAEKFGLNVTKILKMKFDLDKWF